MIVDEIELNVLAGNGGDGHVSFRREKYVPRGGPDGGNGGDGGDVIFDIVSDLSALRKFRYNNTVKGNDGERGQNKKRYGENGKDIFVKIPVGTRVEDMTSDEIVNCDELGQKVLIAKGGKGGRGNFEFRSNENKTPTFAEPGEKGESKKLKLNLMFIADVGLIGLPSVGKSSLLNVLTSADAKIGDYPFTTLEPNLGVAGKTIIADIPGLIEGAHRGKGLGTKFLKHIEKTKILYHCIDSSSSDKLADYMMVRGELNQFDESLLNKDEVIVLTKSDLSDDVHNRESARVFENMNKKVYIVSIADEASINQLKEAITKS